MKRCALLLLATACSHHPHMSTLAPPDLDTTAVAELESGFSGEVRATATPQGPRWVTTNARTGVDEIIDSKTVRSYTTVHRGRGFAEGLAIGGLGGAAVGGLLALMVTDKDSIITPGAAAGFGALIVGGIGLPVGGLIGTIVGSHDVHELDKERAPKLSPMVGDGQAGAKLTGQF